MVAHSLTRTPRWIRALAALVVLVAFARPSLGADKPNIVFILADDFSSDLVQFMPNLQRMQRDGTSFANYFITNSLCCPSRSSILTGKLPHNTRVLTNTRPNGGYAGFNANGNRDATVALALQRVGYKTAMLGKYLNGYEPTVDGPPPGWDEWAVAGNGYRSFNYDLNHNGRVVRYGNAPSDYITDVLSGIGQAFMKKSAGQPFFLEIATFAPHGPYVPAPRDTSAFPNLVAPRSAAFGARPDAAAPQWLRDVPPLTPNDTRNIDRAYRLRAQSVLAIDKIIGDVRALLAASGEDKTTYIVFSSDNGYHMGEYSLTAGKMTAFDTDIHVPLVIVGPGVAKGAVAQNFALNVDLAATFAEWAGAGAPLVPDGRSLVPLLAGAPVADWRQAALIEHLRPARFDDNDPDAPGAMVNPPTYAALRLSSALYIEYATGEVSYYDLARDPFALKNVAADLSAAEKSRLHNQLHAYVNCHGAAACWNAGRLAPTANAPEGPAVPVGIGPLGGRRGPPPGGPPPGRRQPPVR